MIARLRPYEQRDQAELSRICLLTGLSSHDATGHYSDDDLLGDIYAVPYALRDPRYSWVIDDGEGARGYLVATPDTNPFEQWFWDEWWPARDQRYRDGANEATRGLIDRLSNRRVDAARFAAEYPAHLHINLLPELRGAGWGRQLIETLTAQLRADSVPGLHLVASEDNVNAQAFYERLGFHRLASAGGAAFGMHL